MQSGVWLAVLSVKYSNQSYGSQYEGGAHFLMGDDSVRMFSEHVEIRTALGNPAYKNPATWGIYISVWSALLTVRLWGSIGEDVSAFEPTGCWIRRANI